jgi:hypothetical protein
MSQKSVTCVAILSKFEIHMKSPTEIHDRGRALLRYRFVENKIYSRFVKETKCLYVCSYSLNNSRTQVRLNTPGGLYMWDILFEPLTRAHVRQSAGVKMGVSLHHFIALASRVATLNFFFVLVWRPFDRRRAAHCLSDFRTRSFSIAVSGIEKEEDNRKS